MKRALRTEGGEGEKTIIIIIYALVDFRWEPSSLHSGDILCLSR